MRLGVLRRVLSHATGNHLWITALGAFDMRSTGDFLPEAQLWQTVAPALQTTILDAGMPKEHAEVLVAGDVCAPAGRPARGLVAKLELGPIRKRLAVFGQRWWRHGPDGPLMTRPEPFERIPLDWSNAFGGPGHAENPLGKGAGAKAALARGEPAELPLIECAEALITDIEHRPPPVGLGPRAEDAPSRLRYAGIHDDAWLRDGFPGPGRGFDPRYFNVACPDQQSEDAFRGDESFRITAMHPEHGDLRGFLPAFRVRGFASQGGTFRELRVRCDTVWLFPNAVMGIVLFRGGLAVADKEASDVAHVMLAYERLDDPRRALDHYRTAFEERTDPELAALKLFDERPLKPERPAAEVEAVDEERRAAAEDMKQRQEQARGHAVANAFGMAGLPVPAAGLFRDDSPVKVDGPVVTPGEIERLEVDLAGMKAEIDALADLVESESATRFANVGRELARAIPQVTRGADPRHRAMIRDRLSQASAATGGKLVPPSADGPGASAAHGEVGSGPDHLFEFAGRRLEDEAPTAAEAGDRAGAVSPEHEGCGMSAALRRARNRALGVVDEDHPFAGMRASLAAHQGPADAGSLPAERKSGDAGPAVAAKAESVFDTALAALEKSRSASAMAEGTRVSEPDAEPAGPVIGYFSEIARHQAGASGSSGAATTPEAGLVDAQRRLDEASEKLGDVKADGRRHSLEPMAPDEPLSEQDATRLGALALDLVRGGKGLKGRDLAGVDLTGVDLAGMDLEGIFLERARLAGVNFAGANLRTAVLTGADLTGADLTGADLTDGNLSGATLAGARVCDARLDRVRLYRSRLDGADLSRVSLTDVSLIETGLTGVRLAGAVIRDAQFLMCDMSNVSLDGARLNKVLLIESDTAGFRAPAARFERCALIGLQGEDADLTDAEFVASACIGDTKLGRANMRGLVSRRSGWRGTDLSGADLTAARLDENDLGGTNLSDACLHRASLRRTVMQGAVATGANFYGATLLEAQAQDTDFTGASLHRANLFSADLTDARLTRCDLTGANLALTLMTKPANAE